MRLLTFKNWLALSVLVVASGAYAQSPSTKTLMKKITTPSGCAFFVETPDSMQVTRSEGRCVNGLAEGEWVYGFTQAIDAGRGKKENINAVVIGWFKSGQIFGLEVAFTSVGMVRVWTSDTLSNRDYFQKTLFLNMSAAPLRLSDIYRAIDDGAAAGFANGIASPHSVKAKNLAKQWHANMPTFFAQWLPVRADPRSAGAAVDDPKVPGAAWRYRP